MNQKEIQQVVKLVLKQVETSKVQDVEGLSLNLTSTEKRTLNNALDNKKLYKGWKVNGSFKTSRTWTNKTTNKTQTKEFNGVELEKDGKVVKPLFVREGNLLKIWN